MNSKQINLMLWCGAVAIGLAAVGTLLFGFVAPLEHKEIAQTRSAPATSRPAPGGAIPPAAAFEKIWAMTLRQPLGDAPPPSAVAEVAPVTTQQMPVVTSGVPVSLVGTIGTSLAMLKTANNAVEVCGVGESLGGVTVVAVRPSEVDVRFNGQIIKLTKPAE